MGGRLRKLMIMMLATVMIATSFPDALLEARAAQSTAKNQDYTVKITAYSEEDNEFNSVSVGDLQNIDNLLLLSSVGDAEVTPEVTRAEWLHILAQTFKMTVEDDCYPDNYFSDLDSESEYYYDVLLNVEFGVIDVETGGEVRPDDPATREFAAHTLNYCLGYQVDEATAAVCSDIDDSVYKEDLYIAINRGWFETVDGAFLPEQNITQAEADVMIADAQAVLLSMEVDSDAEQNYQLASDVIVITSECEVSLDENEVATITVTDLRETIVEGSRFAVYQNEIPTVYVAQSINVSDNITTITALIDDSGNAFVAADAEGVIDGNVAYVEALDGAELVFVDEETSEEFDSAEQIIALYGANSQKLTKTTVVVKKVINLGDDVTGEIELKLKDAKITYDVDIFGVSAYAYLECDTELSFKCEADLNGYSPIKDLRLVNWTVPGVGGFVVAVDLDMKVSASGVHKGYLKTGIDVSKSKGVRLINNFKAKSFTLVAQAEVNMGMTAKFGITDLPILKAYVYAKVGGKAEVSKTEWTDSSLPRICVDYKAYLYAKYGATGSIKCLGFEDKISIEKTLVNEKNSPIRCVKHYDDGIEVQECKRDMVEDEEGTDDTTPTKKKRYVTPANSSWSGSYWGSGTPSAGQDSNGNAIPMYEYSINKDGETVTITRYNGSATSLVIPETLDGHTVTAIGNDVFENNSKLWSVNIPDSIISIGYKAFYNCSKLESVKLSKRLETMGWSAFGNCDSIETITIPKSLTEAGLPDSGAFGNCTGLKKVAFEEGMTEIPEYLFDSCDGLESIVIPDSVTRIETEAFGNCSNLEEVTFSKNLTSIESRAFSDCISLRSVELPDSIISIGYEAFYNCSSLESAKLPRNLQELESSSFANCHLLSSVEFPKMLTAIGANAFGECDSLATVDIPNTVTTIDKNAFYNCDAVTSIDIPNSVTKIGNYAFYDCDALQKVTIPDSVTSLGTYVFQSCDVLTDVSMGLGLTTIPVYTFADCSKLEGIVIPYNVTAINDYAFKNCTSMTGITIPQKTVTISGNAFSYPGNMSVYGVKGSYAETYATKQGMTFVDQSVPAREVKLPQDSYVVNRNSTITIVPTITPTNFTDLITWKSSDTSIATVDENGKVKGVDLGTATIKVSVGKVSTSCKVTVVQPVTSISLNKTSLSLGGLETYTLTATAYPATANNRTIRWSSSDERIATVSNNGLVTALSKGSCIITATATDGSSVKRTCTVTVTNSAYIVDNVQDLQSSHPYMSNCTDVWQYTIKGADGLSVTFDTDTYMEDGFDYLYILDGEDNQIGKYTGSELSGQTVAVVGDTVRIKLSTDSGSNEYGFKVTDVKAVTPEINYTIAYNKNNSAATGTMSNQTMKYKSGTKLTANKFQRTGYTFTGWNTKADGSGTAYANQVDGSILTTKHGATITLYAQWTPNKYTIKFAGNGATGGTMSSLTNRVYGSSYTLTGNAFTKTGYTFTGWNTKADGKGTAYANKASVKNLTATNGATVTLYARWKQNTYKITYNLNGGKNNSRNPGSYTITTSTITLNAPTKTGHTFKGWYSDSKCTKRVTSISKGSTGNRTLYAKWEANKYNIKFNGNGATKGKMSTLTDRIYGKSYTLKTNAYSRPGYTFTGWNTMKDGSGKTIKNKASVKNLTATNGKTVTLYAQWKKNTYKITYNLNGGKNNSKNPTTYSVTDKTITLKSPTRKGYVFKGWYSDKKCTKKVTKITKGSTGNKTLYAKWVKQ